MEAIEFEEEVIDLEDYLALSARTCFDVLKNILTDIHDITKHVCNQVNVDTRTLKIAANSYLGTSGRYIHVPHIKVRGRRLERAGFEIGETVQVITINGMVLIVLVKPPSLEGEDMVVQKLPMFSAKENSDLLKNALTDIHGVSKYSCPKESGNIRTLKVTKHYYAYERHHFVYERIYSIVPDIRICGRWLERAGFQIGDLVQVITAKGMVLIVSVPIPPTVEHDIGEA